MELRQEKQKSISPTFSGGITVRYDQEEGKSTLPTFDCARAGTITVINSVMSNLSQITGKDYRPNRVQRHYRPITNFEAMLNLFLSFKRVLIANQQLVTKIGTTMILTPYVSTLTTSL